MRNIKVLDTGCCDSLINTVKNHIASKESSGKYEITHITDLPEIYKYGITELPAILIDDETVIVVGELSNEQILEKLDDVI